jgi:hypothetical protein
MEFHIAGLITRYYCEISPDKEIQARFYELLKQAVDEESYPYFPAIKVRCKLSDVYQIINISAIYVYNKTSIKINILNIKKYIGK